jgi:hypothetical protein
VLTVERGDEAGYVAVAGCAQFCRLTCLSLSGFAGTSVWTCILERKYPQASTKQFFAGGLSR